MAWLDLSIEQRRGELGDECYRLIERLYPLCRSITGDGVRQTLRIIGEEIPLSITEVPSGSKAFDWVVPPEWVIRDAYIIGPDGRKCVDFKENNLHLVSYSCPVDATFTLEELKKHLHSIPEHPQWIPYRTSYYNENWGFCLSHEQLQSLPDGRYRVVIDSELKQGSLTLAECVIPGRSAKEFLFFAHICHPSLCNDNLSGISVATQLAKHLAEHTLEFTYRFVFAPATIGSITWLSRNQERLHNIDYGLVISVVGDPGHLTYKKSRRGDVAIDRVVTHVLGHSGKDHDLLDFSPYGYDERQFCSQGIDLPIGRLTRTPNGCYPEYHTSADNLDLVTRAALADSLVTYADIVEVVENDKHVRNLYPFCEPQLGKRGLYRKTGGHQDLDAHILAMLWVLNLGDGSRSLLDIARQARMSFKQIRAAARALLDAKIVEIIHGQGI